ncbi:COX15/CtaA family protein [Aquimarina hainanensis]|uniref:Heme A synthase n=1 Tax=Aquimarina hainanensis TaxID=1578017 RepID=A0ABW5NDJ0_9FLAO|nr:COX15/CtaA family protein [Aquimarina sp. TRL1]QKX03443.1 COX15/CtaA family protein [Aquimarina sp. TRL1]
MKQDNKRVIYWLLTGCFLIFIMVVVGGITRLTHSGLSISNYKLISGTIPPMNEEEWNAAFDLYKQYPEYQKINHQFSLQDFKDIYFWEWIHRVIGRFIGIVFIIPFIYFLFTKQLSKPTIKKSMLLLFLGGFQGFLGWFMVKSGLVDRPDVSHYRLAMHLTTAFITFAYSFWVALDLIFPIKKETVNIRFRNLLRVGLVILIIQIIYGAFVAGLDAGFLHNHWPLMNDGQFIHEAVFIEQSPFIMNFFEGKSGVQFIHRSLAYVVVFIVGLIWYRSKKIPKDSQQATSIKILLVLVCTQFLLGVFTLLFRVPLTLGILHQVVAFFLLGGMTFSLHRFSK